MIDVLYELSLRELYDANADWDFAGGADVFPIVTDGGAEDEPSSARGTRRLAGSRGLVIRSSGRPSPGAADLGRPRDQPG